MKKKAMYFRKLKDQRVLCELCPHYCVLKEGEYGKCKVRTNTDGELYTINYGDVSSIAIDPIEKKPLYHFYPGGRIISIATYGCNFSCKFCQNYRISQNIVDSSFLSVENLIDVIISTSENIGIAFTYNEPFIWYEYIFDAVKMLKEKAPEKKVVLVTNGFVNEEPFKALLPYLDALNIDLKSNRDEFYKDVCGGRLEPVKKIIELAKDTHLEITTLMVTGEVDEEDEIKEIAEFIASINPQIPLHLSRYFPCYNYKEEPTSLSKMLVAQNIAREHLEYVYLGNLAGVDTNTYCPNCNTLLIERYGYEVRNLNNNENCLSCGHSLNIKM